MTGIRRELRLFRTAFSSRPHAHLNLIGGVLLFPFGLYDRLVPAAGTTSLARVQGWLHMIGAIPFPAGIAVICSSPDRGIADRGRGDGAVHRDRVPDLAGLNDRVALSFAATAALVSAVAPSARAAMPVRAAAGSR